MIKLIEELIKSARNGDKDFYSNLISCYMDLSGADHALLFSSDSQDKPGLLCASGSVTSESAGLIDNYLRDYGLLFREIEEKGKKDLSFFCTTRDARFLIFFQSGFRGLLVLVSDSGKFNPEITSETNAFTGIVINLIALVNEKLCSENLIREKNEENLRKTRYLSGLINELRTPINAISGFAQLLKEPDIKNENISKYINIISDTSESIISKISSYSDIADLEAGRIKVFKNKINLERLLKEIVSRYSKMFILKGISLDYKNLVNKNAGYIYGDEAKIRQVLDILISNAYNNTFSGVVLVSSRIYGKYIEFCVSDTGSGISEHDLENIFDYREGQSYMISNSRGSGLGLLIAKLYTNLTGGNIWCKSEEGRGSRFYFTIPNNPVPVNENVNIAAKENDHKAMNAGRKKVLVAEDDNLNFHLIQTFLSKLDLEVLRAENGKQAVDIFKSESIDLVLMDIRMPVMDGYTATRLIRELNQDVKIIAQTAYSNDKSIAVSNGCNDFIAKPFSRNQLVSLVTNYL